MHDGAGGEPFDLAVLGQRDAEAVGVLERPPHQQRILHAVAVVGEDLDADCREFAEWSQVLPGPTDRDRTGRQHLAETGAFALAANEIDHLDAVLGGIGVRHGDHRGEAAECGSAAAGLDRLGLLTTRLAQMHVQVDEAGRDDQPAGVDHVVAVAGHQLVGDLGDGPAVRGEHRRAALRWGR